MLKWADRLEKVILISSRQTWRALLKRSRSLENIGQVVEAMSIKVGIKSYENVEWLGVFK